MVYSDKHFHSNVFRIKFTKIHKICQAAAVVSAIMDERLELKLSKAYD